MQRIDKAVTAPKYERDTVEYGAYKLFPQKNVGFVYLDEVP